MSKYMPEKMILTAGPSITEKEIAYVTDAVTNGWNRQWDSYLDKFESRFADYIGTKHALSTSSCTGAMHLGLLALGIKPGDEIILPNISWVATASVVKYLGATPVFCDIAENSWCIDPGKIEALITSKTKAIFPVHLYGHPANMPRIMEIAKASDLKVIEDAAPSVGAKIADKRTGSFGDVAGFSFQGAKVLVTGEGGMLVTNSDEIYQRSRFLGDHGRNPNSPLSSVEVGYKYKMSNIQAALGLAQLERIEELVKRKREINARYRKNLIDCQSVSITGEAEGAYSIMWMTSIELVGMSAEKRKKFMQTLKEKNIDSRPVFSPLSSLPMFEKSCETPVAYRIGQSAINLPSGHNLTNEEIDYISSVIIDLYK